MQIQIILDVQMKVTQTQSNLSSVSEPSEMKPNL